jgi:hypothetical protein
MKPLFLAILAGAITGASATDWASAYAGLGRVIVTNFDSAPFPHPQRAVGHKYKDKHYPAETHYRDSTVMLFVPRGVCFGGKVDFVVHFHGWFNHVSKALDEFKLIDQFVESRRNAVLVAPQGPRDAPDSFGGKLEDPGGFQRFMREVLATLQAEPPFRQAALGDVILSGHSGGYHVMASILARGGLSERVKEVWLFDALYGETAKFRTWQGQTQGRLLNIYTERGGTREETEKLMADLKAQGTKFLASSHRDAKPEDLRAHRLVFLDTDLGHNEVLAKRQTFRQFLETSGLPPLPEPSSEVQSAK